LQSAREKVRKKTQSETAVRASISFPPQVYEGLEIIAREKKVSLAWLFGRCRAYIGDRGRCSNAKLGIGMKRKGIQLKLFSRRIADSDSVCETRSVYLTAVDVFEYDCKLNTEARCDC